MVFRSSCKTTGTVCCSQIVKSGRVTFRPTKRLLIYARAWLIPARYLDMSWIHDVITLNFLIVLLTCTYQLLLICFCLICIFCWCSMTCSHMTSTIGAWASYTMDVYQRWANGAIGTRPGKLIHSNGIYPFWKIGHTSWKGTFSNCYVSLPEGNPIWGFKYRNSWYWKLLY